MAGFPYQAAVGLAGLLAYYWNEVDGAFTWAGVDTLALSVPRLLNAVYSWAINKFTDPKDRDRWINELYARSTSGDPDRVSDDVVAEEMAMFHSLKSQTGG